MKCDVMCDVWCDVPVDIELDELSLQYELLLEQYPVSLLLSIAQIINDCN